MSADMRWAGGGGRGCGGVGRGEEGKSQCRVKKSEDEGMLLDNKKKGAGLNVPRVAYA
jgi:hypothetical protein